MVKQNYNPTFHDQLDIPIYMPVYSDRIIIELLDKVKRRAPSCAHSRPIL